MKNIEMYLGMMQEVKRRTATIYNMLAHKTTTGYRYTDVEFMCLQIRKILELIALGSLVLNQEQFEEQAEKFRKAYHAKRILNDIKEINPDGYPKPIIEQPLGHKYIKGEFKELETGYLTEKDFAKVYEKCGKICHASNPLGSKIDIAYYEDHIFEWIEKIKSLLNSHIITLVGDDNLYIVHMREERDDKVHGYIFENTGIQIDR